MDFFLNGLPRLKQGLAQGLLSKGLRILYKGYVKPQFFLVLGLPKLNAKGLNLSFDTHCTIMVYDLSPRPQNLTLALYFKSFS